MSDLKSAAKLALEALDIAQGMLADLKSQHQPKMLSAYTAIKEALADPMREVQRLGQEIEQEQLISDQINYGMSVTQGGKRIDPMSIYKEPEQEPVCPDCKAKVLYECVACSSNNYPPQQEKALQTLHAENERLGLYRDAYAEPESECNPQDLCAGCRCKYAHVQPEQEPVALPCCGYTDASAVKWNPVNGVVQCHNCGQTYTPTQRTEQEENKHD